MPCHITGSREGDMELRMEELRSEAIVTNELLCKTLNRLPEYMIKSLPQDVQDWWENHKELDRQRAERERAEMEEESIRREVERYEQELRRNRR